jgi:ribosomal protein L31
MCNFDLRIVTLMRFMSLVFTPRIQHFICCFKMMICSPCHYYWTGQQNRERDVFENNKK